MAEKKTTRKTSKKEAVASTAPSTAPSAPPDAIYAYIVGAEDIGTLADACRSVSCPVYIVADPTQVEALAPDTSKPIIDDGKEAILCIWHQSELNTDPTVADLKARIEATYVTVAEPGE